MPFVRYARDRRGYDTVYVMHAFEGAEKNPRVRVLYACRTVPHAKVGRLSLDEGVQRRIQQAYPSLNFDWPRLLKEAAASAPRPERPDPRGTEPRGKQRRERKAKGAPAAQVPKGPKVPQVPQVLLVPQVRFTVPEVLVPVPQVQEPEPLESSPSIDTPEPLEPITEQVEWTALDEPEPEPEPEREREREPRTEPGEPMERVEPMEPQVQVGALVVDPAWPVVAVVGAARAMILRGRYIELAHRVLSRVSSPGERARLLREAARLNPETWTSEEQAREAVAGFETAYGRLAEQLRQPPSA